MQMKEILEYQKLDGKIRKIENEIKNSEDRKNASKMQDYLRDSQVKLVKLEEQSEKLVKIQKKAIEAYNDFALKLEQAIKEEKSSTPAEVSAQMEKLKMLNF